MCAHPRDESWMKVAMKPVKRINSAQPGNRDRRIESRGTPCLLKGLRSRLPGFTKLPHQSLNRGRAINGHVAFARPFQTQDILDLLSGKRWAADSRLQAAKKNFMKT
ncbi:hypothetical protein EDC30_12123 [Paucimonas lemoignei]|uniref:Uncharacterized protein n=1 Tax=Paucimonas lemoignei TaxID=29443 RepID=A0A4R3HQM2_PAULE|nr:hypothetical protein EDC30_12123 [Paucimonas lemoignei]